MFQKWSLNAAFIAGAIPRLPCTSQKRKRMRLRLQLGLSSLNRHDSRIEPLRESCRLSEERPSCSRIRIRFLFCGVQGSLGIAPAMKAALRDHFWNMAETARKHGPRLMSYEHARRRVDQET